MVIHADPCWNAAARDQATDRAHRIGQTEDVNVYRVVAKTTITRTYLGASGILERARPPVHRRFLACRRSRHHGANALTEAPSSIATSPGRSPQSAGTEILLGALEPGDGNSLGFVDPFAKPRPESIAVRVWFRAWGA